MTICINYPEFLKPEFSNSDLMPSNYFEIKDDNSKMPVSYLSNLANSWISLDKHMSNESQYEKPSNFDAIFLEYADLINLKNENLISKKTKIDIIAKMDELLNEFPIESFSEISSIYFEWDDTTRIVLDYAPEELKLNLIKDLNNIFSEIYSKIRNSHTTSSEKEILKVEKKLVSKRNEIMLNYYTPSGENKEFVNKLMEDLYNIP